MAGKLEPLRRLLSKKYFRPFRDRLIRLAWRLDPELSALGWLVLGTVLSESRRKEFLSWVKYDKCYRQLRAHLVSDSEWRYGPIKSWDVALGPLRALRYIHRDPGSCRALDFGCGTHFSDSTGIILYLCGVQAVDCLEISNPVSGFENGAALDLIHWIKDQLVVGSNPPLPDGVNLDRVRLDELHKIASLRQEGRDFGELPPISLTVGDICRLEWEEGRYDLITSNAVLEHIEDPEMIWMELKRLLQVGGAMHHVIDFRDHRSYYHPDAFEPLPAICRNNEWGDPDTNGWRYEDWMRMIEEDPDLELVENQHRLLDGSRSKSGLNSSKEIADCELIIRRVS